MTIDHLRYFLAAAKYLNFSKAAEAVYIHPTTMSRSIVSMEEELGTPLFLRLKYSLQLTSVGSQFRVDAEQIVEAYDHMISKAKKVAAGITGRVTLFAPQLYYQMLADAFRDFILKHPQVEFAVDVCPFSRMDSICPSVLDGTVDMGITFSQNFHDENDELMSIKIYEEVQYLTVPTNHPLAQRKEVRLSELRDTRLLLADHLGKENLLKILNAVDSSNSVDIMHSMGETLLLEFTAGLGLTFMPGIVAPNSGGNFSSLKILDFDGSFDVLLIWKKNRNNPALDSFVESVRQFTPLLHPVQC